MDTPQTIRISSKIQTWLDPRTKVVLGLTVALAMLGCRPSDDSLSGLDQARLENPNRLDGLPPAGAPETPTSSDPTPADPNPGGSGTGSGSSGAQTPDAGQGAADAAPVDPGPPAAVCGNGVVETGETCDEGASNGGYGRCGTDCRRPAFPPPAAPRNVTTNTLASPPACTAGDWMTKYLHYRRRLRGDATGAHPGFVSIGAAAGQSIPASNRDPTTDCARDWWMMDAGCALNDFPDAQGKYNWGDATIWLGSYLSVLATEYAAFDRIGVDTSQTIEDLYYAIMAFNRVDEAAEIQYGATPVRDGFFVRDDVPGTFYLAADGTYRFPRSEPGLAGYECTRSAGGCGTMSIEGGDYVSQDQVVGLVHGLALVNKLVPDGVVHDGVDLRHEARAIVHRMVWHLRSNGWRVKDPDGNSPPDKWGGNAVGTAYNLARVANVVCGTDFGVTDYRDNKSETLGAGAVAALEAGWSVTHGYNRTMALRLEAITNGWSASKMAGRAAKDAKELYALSHAVLHDIELDEEISTWRIESLLGSAPCQGPCNATPGCNNGKAWKGEHRFMNPESRAGCKHRSQAEFNGMDYMTLHNLYLVYRDGRYGYSSGGRTVGSRRCDSFTGLSDMLETGISDGDTYDPQDPCAASDMDITYCGRSWASWLDAAYRGQVEIYTANARWTCSGNSPCVLQLGSMEGTSGVDLMIGTPGGDDIRGRQGDGCVYGLGGDDRIQGGRGRDEIDGGDGADEVYGEGTGIYPSGEADILWGDAGDDMLKGGPGGDEVYGGPGADRLIGDAGGDFIEGDAGDDFLQGDAGDDVMVGGDGDDEIHGDAGSDVAWGNAGRDKIEGDSGDDWMWGGDGDDFLKGDNGDDRLFAGPGHDRLCGKGGDDDLWGNWDGDECRGGGFMGGTDSVQGCEDDSASQRDCKNAAFEGW